MENLMTTKILAFAGSVRKSSFNKILVKIAAEEARSAGAEVTYLDFADLTLPLYDEDWESAEGLPDHVITFKALLRSHQGFLIACPEYNSSITPLLKNAIDWASRPEPNQPSLVCFKDKVVGLMSASPGALGGLRGLVHVRSILGNIGVLVLPDQVAIGKADQAFDPNGNLIDQAQQTAIMNLSRKLVTIATQVHHCDVAELKSGG
jgi:chromate reductase, NAD(P)H dehydrogenase (quinone)